MEEGKGWEGWPPAFEGPESKPSKLAAACQPGACKDWGLQPGGPPGRLVGSWPGLWMAGKMAPMPTESRCLWIFAILAGTSAVLFLALALTFLGLYLECQRDLRNRTALADEAGSAQRELRELWATQEDTSRSLAKTRGQWEACRNQLEDMARNITTQVAEAARREEEKCSAEKQKLRQEISDRNQELKTAQGQIRAERDQCAAETQQLEAQLKKSSSDSSQITFALPRLTFLLLFFLLLL